mgnify:CR=1 FL=1
MFMTFHGKPRADKHTMEHVHESPQVMTIPLGVLAFWTEDANAFAWIWSKLGLVLGSPTGRLLGYAPTYEGGEGVGSLGHC